ncbi:MAG: signal peptidase I [Pseudomonadota bacterium]
MSQIEQNKPADATEVPAEGRLQTFWREWRGFFLFVVVMLLFRSAIADWNHVPSGSMLPSIYEGDRIVVDKMAYDLRVPFTFISLHHRDDPQRSDVITFEHPQSGRMLVKRVIGVPGDRVEYRNNRLFINGEAATYDPLTIELPEQQGLDPRLDYQFNRETILGNTRTVMYANRRVRDPRLSFVPVTVPEKKYLVLGDNRDNSHDSRFIGLIDRHLILGKANHIAFSLDQENYYIPRGDRFLEALE